MTCIAAAYKNGHGAIGCDSMVSGIGTGVTVTTKVLELGASCLAGVAGMAITIEELRQLPEHEAENQEEHEEYLRGISSMLREKQQNSHVLTLSPWGIWLVDGHGVFKITHPIAAIGSGGDIALGAMNTTVKRLWWTPKATVQRGLEHACEIAPGCGRPITIKTL